MSESRPPGPPAPPRCPECRGPRSVGGSAIRWHEPDCSIGQAGQRSAERDRRIIDALTEAVHERRKDDDFMERLRERLETDKNILDRLASTDKGSE